MTMLYRAPRHRLRLRPEPLGRRRLQLHPGDVPVPLVSAVRDHRHGRVLTAPGLWLHQAPRTHGVRPAVCRSTSSRSIAGPSSAASCSASAGRWPGCARGRSSSTSARERSTRSRRSRARSPARRCSARSTRGCRNRSTSRRSEVVQASGPAGTGGPEGPHYSRMKREPV